MSNAGFQNVLDKWANKEILQVNGKWTLKQEIK